MGKQFFLFIVVIRALAAVVITNSHYTGVYPTDLIANGGLLGDVLFLLFPGIAWLSHKTHSGNGMPEDLSAYTYQSGSLRLFIFPSEPTRYRN